MLYIILFLYFAFGLLNIFLLYLFIISYKHNTGVDLETDDKIDMYMNMISCFISGPFGTMVIILFGLFLYSIWRKHYRKK